MCHLLAWIKWIDSDFGLVIMPIAKSTSPDIASDHVFGI